MEKELEKMIRNKELKNEEWQELVCDLIKIIPENKYNRFNYLLNRDTLTEDLDFDEITGMLDKLIKDAENAKYYYSSYYDYGLDEEVVEGDESWIDEIDRAFRGIKGLFNQKKYEQVVILYEKIFEITEGNYEEFYNLLPGYYHIEEKIESKLQEHYLNYLEAIYYSKNIDRIQKYVEVFIDHRYEYTKGNIIHEFCKKHNEFTEKMIKPMVQEFAEKKYMHMYEIIFKLLMEENGTKAVMEFLEHNIKENIRVFSLLYNFMLSKENYKELLENLFILENVDMAPSQKEIIYKKIIIVANIIKNESLKEKYLYKINELNPSLKYTLEICKKLPIEKKIEQIENLNEKFIVKEENQEEKILIELILGKIEIVYVVYEKMKGYQKEKIENLIIYYLLKFGNKEIKEKKLLTKELTSEIKEIDSSLQVDEIFNIMKHTKNDKISKEFIEKIEKNFTNKIAKKTKSILGSQARGSYQKVANYLVILVEHIHQEGRTTEAKVLLQKYQEEYKKYNLYRKCIQEELKKSSIVE